VPVANARRFFLVYALAASVLAGCNVEWTRKHELYCRMDEQLQLRDTLYFGLSIPGGGTVGDTEWTQFADDAIGHAFPNGFTVVEARGSWRGADGTAVSEPSRVVTIVHPDDGVSDAAIRAIVQRYRSTFRQEAVLREQTSACVSQ
jgi:uncharacterized protein DUF3574